jgi:cytochrome c556
MLRAFVATAVLVGGLAASAFAQSAAIGERQTLLKAWGQATGPVGRMLRGEAAFDNAAVQNALSLYARDAAKLAALFPDDSKTGGETKALPAIWEKKAEFTQLWTKVADDAKAAQAAIKDEVSFKAEMPKVLGNCGTCHNAFRAK